MVGEGIGCGGWRVAECTFLEVGEEVNSLGSGVDWKKEIEALLWVIGWVWQVVVVA